MNGSKECFAGQFPQSSEEKILMRQILDSMKPHFREKYKHQISTQVKPPANKRSLVANCPELNVTPQCKRNILKEPKYEIGTYTPIKAKNEIKTTVCKYCDGDTVNGDYCDNHCEAMDKSFNQLTA